MRNIVKRQTGITLIALVVTIIVLIILAGVSIAMLVGENGIITQAQRAAQETEQTKKDEEAGLSGLETAIQEAIGNVYNERKGVNAPKLTGNMKLVTFNSADNTWVEDTTKNAYSYVDTSIAENGNKSEWANAEVTVDGITSYFVWIPRYAYKITYYTDENKTTESSTTTAYGTIDVKFIKGIGNIATDGTICKYANENPDVTKDYLVHPAFTKDANYGGGWDNELSGIWIGKYEASLANKADGSNIVTDDEETGNILLSDNTNKTVVTKPGYSSWRYVTVGNMYTNALAYSTELKSHMLKNSEWGAVAYLTDSKYGRNGTEIGINQSLFFTGGGEETAYVTNAEQSSTGNVYGVYDLNGGAWERTASYYNGSDVNTTNFNNGSSFASINAPSNEYITAYSETIESIAYKYGDATYETRGWHSDDAGYEISEYPFFGRGGQHVHTDTAGVFCYNVGAGAAISTNSFRIALVL